MRNVFIKNIFIEVPIVGKATMVFEDENGNKNRLIILDEFGSQAEIMIEQETTKPT